MKNSKNLEPIGMEKPRWIFQGTWNRIAYSFAMISLTYYEYVYSNLRRKMRLYVHYNLVTKISLSIGV